MTPADRRRTDQALEWVRLVHDPAFADWAGHIAWLEADPANAVAFDEAALMIDDATEGLASPRIVPRPVNDNPPAADHAERPRRRRWAAVVGFAVAAGVAAIVAIPSLIHGDTAPREIVTAAGEHRTIALADGTTVALNGDSRLTLDPATPRLATLERGEAYFTVVHDAAHPFEVRSGDALFRDVGTQFDIVRDAGATEIAVREGAVLFDPAGTAVRIDGGHAMRIRADSATLRPIAADTVGGWRSGRLTYRDASLTDIAADVARAIGEPVAVAPELAQRRFSGVVVIDPDHALTVRRLGAVMGIALHREGSGWRMVSPAR